MTYPATAKLESKRAKWAFASVPVLALLTAAVAMSVLILWLTTTPLQHREWPYVFLMKSNTALCLVLLAFSLFGLWTQRYAVRVATAVCACIVLTIAAASLTEYLLPVDFGIDQWMAVDDTAERWPGRISLGMALGLLMMASAYLILSSSRSAILSQAMLLAALVIPITAVGGYLYRAPDSSPFYRGSVLSLQSALCTFFLCIGGACLRPDAGLMRILLSESAAGTVARRLLAAAILMPAALGACILYAQHVGLMANEFGFATLITCSALFFSAAVWIVSAMIIRSETARGQAESNRDAAERRVQIGEQRLHIALDAARLGSWEYLAESNELITSAQCKAIYGFKPTDPFPYAEFLSAIIPEERERVQASAQQALAASSDYKEQYEVKWPDGSAHWVLAYGRPLFDENGENPRMVGVSLDVTESVRFREAMELADRRKDEFLATLAHELRNPLAPIRQAVTVARSETATPAQRSWGLNVIDRQASHMGVLLDDLLDVSRITRGRMSLQKDSVDVSAVVDAALETAQPAITAKSQRVQLNLAADCPKVFLDPVRTAQMLSNLLINASKYSGAGAQITVGVAVHADRLEFSVRDEGIGLAADMLCKIFEMFTQVEVDRTRAGGGLGIGLALVRGLAELHGGSVIARSEGHGKGSEFIISLPRSAAVADFAVPPETPTHSIVRRILIADDNQDALETLKILLEMDGHEIATAANGEQALLLAEQNLPGVMLLDLGMPGLSGLELAARIRERPWGSGITLIAITGWGQAEDRRRSLEAGFNHHLTKPVDLDALRALLNQDPRELK